MNDYSVNIRQLSIYTFECITHMELSIHRWSTKSR